MIKILRIIIVLCTTFYFYNCKNINETKSITKKVVFTKEGDLQLLKGKSDSIITTLDLEIADDDYQTQTGLMYRKTMEDHQAMLFIFKKEQPRSFYMKNTEFSIDIIFINKDKEIVNIHKSAKPYDKTSLPSEGPILYVLEINAGLSKQWTLEKGDKITWTKN